MTIILALIICISINIYFLTLTEQQKNEYLFYYKKIVRNISLYSLYQHVYCYFYKYVKVREKHILIESHTGNGIRDNMYALVKELHENKKYQKYKIYLVVSEREKLDAGMKKIINEDGKRFTVVKRNSLRYYHQLSQSKYLFNDVTFPQEFIKKEEQIYCNTWHGTPIKAMGKFVSDRPIYLQNSQRNFLLADYLVTPNVTLEKMFLNDYMLGENGKAKFVKTGYPKDDLLANVSNKKYIKDSLEVPEATKIVCLMPTWREYDNELELDIYISELNQYISFLGENLSDDYKMYVRLHPKAEEILTDTDLIDSFRVPENVEINELLSVTDILVTDYSSVMFDFLAVKDSRVILFPHDIEDYVEQRGIDIKQYKALPFTTVYDKHELLREIVRGKNIDDQSIEVVREAYCPHTKENNSEYLLDTVLEEKRSETSCSKKRVLIFVGQLLNNGITTSFKNLMKNINHDKYEITFCFMGARVARENYKNLYDLTETCNYIPIKGRMTLTPFERLRYLWGELIKLDSTANDEFINSLYGREKRRLFGDIQFDDVVHFTGYDKKPAALFPIFEASSTIFVHNDMIREQKTRNNFNPIYLKRAWKDFDRVAVVRESLKPTCIEFFPKVESKLVTVHNTIDLDAYSLKSGEPLEEQIEDKVAIDDLVDTNLIKIITIGRLSPEKGHLRLITAFEKAAIDNEALRLYIVGGHGKSEELLVNRIEDSIVKDKIHLVTTVSNPYPLLKFSDGFILSSFYEGLPMVFSEAVMAGVPIVSVSIDGPTEFLNQGFGKVVSNSVTGIYDGITMLANKEVKPASLVKLSEFNSNALTEFDDILK